MLLKANPNGTLVFEQFSNIEYRSQLLLESVADTPIAFKVNIWIFEYFYFIF